MSFNIDERLQPLYVINIYDEHMPLAQTKRLFAEVDKLPVSYTHLDVYKRQPLLPYLLLLLE